MIEKIISGGQTGVDIGALKAAVLQGIPTGGWAPKGWMTENGPSPSLARYGLKEYTKPGYPARTLANIQDSDGTLVLSSWQVPSKGTHLTINTALAQNKPLLICDFEEKLVVEVKRAAKWIKDNKIKVLNVAGPRASKYPTASDMTRIFIDELVRKLK